MRLVGTSGSIQSNSYTSRDTQSKVHKITSKHLLNILKDGDSMTSPGNLCQSLVTLRLRNCFRTFRRTLLHFNSILGMKDLQDQSWINSRDVEPAWMHSQPWVPAWHSPSRGFSMQASLSAFPTHTSQQKVLPPPVAI